MTDAQDERLAATAIVLTYNEEFNLGPCLRSLRGSVREILVVDSFSTDRTVDIAVSAGCHVVQHVYENHRAQWEWVLSEVDIKTPWFLAVDADFRLSSALSAFMLNGLYRLPPDVGGVYIRHIQRFWGKTLRWGGVRRSWLRILRTGFALVDTNDAVDLHFYTPLRCVTTSAAVIEDNANDLNMSSWMNKQIRFAARAVREEQLRRSMSGCMPVVPSVFGTSDQRTLVLKRVWSGFPRYWRSVAYFLARYLGRLGFLDGEAGFLYHFSQALVYRILVDSRMQFPYQVGRKGAQTKVVGGRAAVLE